MQKFYTRYRYKKARNKENTHHITNNEFTFKLSGR